MATTEKTSNPVPSTTTHAASGCRSLTKASHYSPWSQGVPR